VKTEAASSPTGAAVAIYGRAFNNVHFGHIDIKGFVGGVLFASGNNWSVDQITIEDVDFGAFGQPGDGCQIGQVNGINILKSQGVNPHAVYFPGDASNIGNGLTIGEITCAGVESGAAIVSLKYQKNFAIGSIVGHTDVASPLTLLEATGSIGIIDVESTKEDTSDAPASNILVQTNSEVMIGQIRMSSDMDDDTDSYAAINCVASSKLWIDYAYIQMKNATPGSAFRCSADMYINFAHVVYDNAPTTTKFAFLPDAGFIRVGRFRLEGTNQILRGITGGTYELSLSPDDCDTALDDTSITTNTGVYNTKFLSMGEVYQSFTDGDLTPAVRGGNLFQTANTTSKTITDFDFGSPGQQILVKINDANTTIDFTASGLKGNAGVDWVPGSGDFLKATYDGTDWLCEIYEI